MKKLRHKSKKIKKEVPQPVVLQIHDASLGNTSNFVK